jgi:plastocyanin
MTLALRGLVPAIVVTLCAPTFASQLAPIGGSGAAGLTGRVTLLLPPRVQIDPGGTVVWIPGLTISSAGAAADASVTSKDKRFQPRILVVTSGTKVKFPNLDGIYHNAFSLSQGNTFDVGLYRKGASRDVVLKSPGVVRVYCNIHPDMAASIVVVDGNAFALVGDDGSYHIDGIPPGRYDVHLWSDVAGEQVVPLVFGAGRTTDWSPALDATKYQRVAHTNKHGKAYPKAKNDADRY